MAAALAAAGVTVGGVVAGTSATTYAQFSASAKGAGAQAAAATVELGHGGGSVALGYRDLKPGARRVVHLTIAYQGNVPADVSLRISPFDSSALCLQHDGRWQPRPGGAVTVAVGTAEPVSYCELLNGQALPLASAVPPGSQHTVEVAVLLSAGAEQGLRGVVEEDVATVRASGGFTDDAVGTISIAIAAGGDQSTHGSGNLALQVNGATAPEPSPLSPPLPSGSLPVRPPVVLPAECEQAGMRLDGFADVIVLSPDQPVWKALELGAGPFLVVGTDGDDEIVGSAGADCIIGGGGRDELSGGAGNDVLVGGEGDDLFDPGLGNDWLFGGPGIDDLREGGGIDRFDDGVFCHTNQDTAGLVRCQVPTPPATPTSASPAPASPAPVSPTPVSPTPVSPAPTSPPATTSPSITPPAQAEPSDVGEDQSAAG